MKNKELFLTVPVLFIALFLFHCSSNGPVAGDGTHVGNAITYGYVYNQDNTPASGASVKFVPISYNPHAAAGLKIDSAITDSRGYYKLPELGAGTYNILASGTAGAVSFRDSVAVGKDTTDVGKDTLHSPGSIRGVVKLVPPVDSAMVFVILLGTNTYAMADSSGNFELAGLAQGEYRALVLTTSADYGRVDTVWAVQAGESKALQDTVVLPYKGIPVVTGLKVSYDTLKQIVTLTWSKADTALTKGYYVYRRNVDSSAILARINTSLITDTLFRDSTGVQDMTYEYKVAAVSTVDMEGTKSSVVTTLIATYFHVDSIYGGTGSNPGQFDNPTDFAISKNGNIYVVDNANKRIQVFDQNMSFQFEFGTSILNRPASITLDSLENIYISDSKNIFVFNSLGNISNTIVFNDYVGCIEIIFNELFVIKGQDSIIVLSLTGQPIRAWKGNYWYPQSLAAGDSNNILISDDGNQRIVICDTLGSEISNIPLPVNPGKIAFDARKRYLFVNLNYPLGEQLDVFNANKDLIAKYKYKDSFGNPSAITVSAEGHIFVALGTGGTSRIRNSILKMSLLLP